jgi:5-methylcytosine-specific restriction endonuclease McrA
MSWGHQREEYQKYIRSKEWKQRASRMRKLAGYRCQRCGKKGVPLDVHHLTYERFGNERDSDLLVVCRPCHRIEDNIRRGKNKSRRVFIQDVNVWQEYLKMSSDQRAPTGMGFRQSIAAAVSAFTRKKKNR